MFKKGLLLFMASVFLFFSGFASLPGEEVEEEVRLLTLDESIEIALENNAEVLIKKEEIKEAVAGIKEARSGLLPQLDANADYYNYHDHPYLTYEENYQTNVSLTQVLYAGGQLINSLRQSKLNLEATGEKQRRTRQEIIFKVEEVFYSVLLAEEFVRINQETLSLAEEQLRIARERYHAGEVSNYDVLRAEVEVATVKPELVKAENYLQVAQNEFKFILGLDLATLVKVKGDFAYLPKEVNLDDTFAAAFASRPELKEMEANRKMGELGVKIAKGGSKPTVSLIVGNYWDEKSAFSVREEWDDYGVGLISVDVPIFDGLGARAKTQGALAQLNAVKISEENLKERVKLEVENASLSLKAAQEVVASQAKNVEKASECLGIMQTRYKQGKATQLDLLDAQVALSRVKVSYAQSIYEHTIAKASLKLAVGKE
ncbi:MAG: TolC family protein [Euryarchaeota archaeon]|nr:TolC family protein [Euryarchaeota archaeon]